LLKTPRFLSALKTTLVLPQCGSGGGIRSFECSYLIRAWARWCATVLGSKPRTWPKSINQSIYL